MKVLFIYTNINGQHADSFADGIAMIMAVTKQAGHEIKMVQIFDKKEYPEFTKEVKEFKPDVIGFTAVSSQFSFVIDLSKLAKSISPKIINVCGGVHTTLYPQSITESKALDAVFIGDGEGPFLDLLKKIESNQDWKDTDNIAFQREDGTMKKNKLRALLTPEELTGLPHPDRSTFPFEKTLKMVGVAPFHFTRGCPFTCTYCSNIGIAKVYGQTRYNIRQATPEHSIQEIEEVMKNNPLIGPVYKIYLTDDIFGLNKKWRREFLKLYRKRIKVPFICLLRCDVATRDTIEDLARGYCDTIQFGVESGNDYIRNTVMSRDMARETIVNAFKLTKEYGVKTHAINIIGVPGETKEMMLDTVKLNREIKPTATSANIFYPYKGTPLGEECFEKGLVDLEMYNDFSNERRDSVLKYSDEWKATLRYYRSNWNKEIYPYDYKRIISENWSEFKNQIKSIPVIGPALKEKYVMTREGLNQLKLKYNNKFKKEISEGRNWYR